MRLWQSIDTHRELTFFKIVVGMFCWIQFESDIDVWRGWTVLGHCRASLRCERNVRMRSCDIRSFSRFLWVQWKFDQRKYFLPHLFCHMKSIQMPWKIVQILKWKGNVEWHCSYYVRTLGIHKKSLDASKLDFSQWGDDNTVQSSEPLIKELTEGGWNFNAKCPSGLSKKYPN